jgi:hypothetical protein
MFFFMSFMPLWLIKPLCPFFMSFVPLWLIKTFMSFVVYKTFTIQNNLPLAAGTNLIIF